MTRRVPILVITRINLIYHSELAVPLQGIASEGTWDACSNLSGPLANIQNVMMIRTVPQLVVVPLLSVGRRDMFSI